MRFELAIAWRYFISSRSQTLLTVAGATVGVTVLIFISALVGGVERTMIARILGTVAPVVVLPPRPLPRVLGPPARAGSASAESGLPEVNLATRERYGRERERINQWQRVVATLRGLPGVTAVSPVVEGPAFAVRGTVRRPVLLRGVDPEAQNQIVNVAARIQQGTFDLAGDGVVIGTALAHALGAMLNDKIRLTSSELRTDTFRVTGIFDLGFANLNEQWVFVSRGSAERLLALTGYVTGIELQTRNLFGADRLADRVALLTGLRAESWSRADPEFLASLEVQSASSLLVQGFILVAVAFGIASVLVVAALQRSRDIGILRSMGTPSRSIAAIFLTQAGLIGVTGALLGTGVGITLSLVLRQIGGQTAGGERLFPIEVQVADVARAAGAAVLASLIAGFIPARRAAALDPVEVIHGA